MKITDVRTIPLRGATHDTGWPGGTDPNEQMNTLLEIRTDEGATGIGSCFTSLPFVEASLTHLKPMLLGGLLRALELARRAMQRGLRVIVTTSLDGAIARAGAAHLAAAVLAQGPQPAAGLATGRLLESDLCPDPLAPRDGVVRIPDKPGLL